MKPPTKRRAGWLAAELLVVFAGVTLAFLLEGYRAERAVEERRAEIVSAVVEELRGIAQGASQAETEAEAALETYRDSATSRPVAPRPISPFLPFRPYVWNAALESGAIEALDADQMLALSRLYARVDELRRTVDRAAAYSRDFIVPRLDEPAAAFYRDDGQRLRPRYGWYVEYFERVRSEAAWIQARADSLAGVLVE